MNLRKYKPEKETLGSLVQTRLLALSRRDASEEVARLESSDSMTIRHQLGMVHFYNKTVDRIEKELEKRELKRQEEAGEVKEEPPASNQNELF